MTYTKLPIKNVKNHGFWGIFLAFVSLVIGLIVGFCIARLFEFETLSDFHIMLNAQNQHIRNYTIYNRINAENLKEEHIRHTHSFENSSVAQKLYKEVRVLCWIMTNPANHKTKAIHVQRTWGQRCNKLIFISSAEDAELKTIALNISEGRDHLWGKTKGAFKYIYENHMNDADWFLKADDDTYVIVENLRYMLYSYAPETPIYFGCKFKPIVKQGYMSGGAGYVLSKEAVRRFVTEALPNVEICQKTDAGPEDAEIGKCLQNVQVIAGDSRDSEGRGRFFPMLPELHLSEKKAAPNWYWEYIYYKIDVGMHCCSDKAISFHYIPPERMYAMDYMIYHLSPFGIAKTEETLPKKLTLEEIKTSLNISSGANFTDKV